ncbi:MAG: hypothetical protein U1C73_05850, partial [Dietzia sp.]|nr:hypothetical protein [Dietzia sp.]
MELVVEYRSANLQPDPVLLHHYAAAAHMLGEFEESRRSAELAVASGHLDSLGLLAHSYRALAHHDAATKTSRRALDHDPRDYIAANVLFGTLLEDGRHRELWDYCSSQQASGVWNVGAPSAMALAASDSRQHARVRELVSNDLWFSMTHLGFDAEFNAAVCSELRRRATGRSLP